MSRAIFLAFGVTLIIMGAELFFVDQVEVLRLRRNQKTPSPIQSILNVQPASFQNNSQSKTANYRPDAWIAWSLLAVGAIVLIYTFTIPKRRME